MSGAINMNGTTDGQRLRVGVSIGDLYPATVAALGICAAILETRASGAGQFLDVAMYDALVALCEATVYRYSYTGVIDAPAGNGHYQLVPFNIYSTRDGSCAIAAPNDRLWAVLCKAIGRNDLLDDDQTRGYRRRYANRDMVNAAIESWTSQRSTTEVLAALGGRVPVGPVHTNGDLFDDPHLYARDMLVAVEHAGAQRPVVFPNSPIHYTRTPAGIYRRAPKLGEHTTQVLAEVGVSRTESVDGAQPSRLT
jgi:crotonobetainyl-CoA:carnitine CoA-transferase CaiB-like acyl-CoA transferase